MHASDRVILFYLAYMAVAALIVSLPARRRLTILAATATLASFVLAATRLDAASAPVRDWLPLAWVLAGYWISGLFFVRPMVRVERWLLDADRRFFEATGLTNRLARAPRPVLEALELSYLLCYPMLPAGLFVLGASGFWSDADRYWTTVLGAELAAYACLPWIQTRPPRALEGEGVLDRRGLTLRALNLKVLSRGSIQVNTVPSGHAAGAVAVTMSVASVSPLAGVVFGLVALSIMAASVAGRYHYLVDAILGAAVGLGAAGLAVQLVNW